MPKDTFNEIDGYTVELEFNTEDGEERSHAYISKGKYSASLECLDSTGSLFAEDAELAVTRETISKIRRWCESKGY